MATVTKGLVRLDIENPEDLQKLVTSGLIWRSGPQTLQRVFRSIMDGVVQRNPDREPPEVRSYLDKAVSMEVPGEEQT